MRIPRLAAAVVVPALATAVLVIVPVGAAQAATSTEPGVITPAGVVQAAMSANPDGVAPAAGPDSHGILTQPPSATDLDGILAQRPSIMSQAPSAADSNAVASPADAIPGTAQAPAGSPVVVALANTGSGAAQVPSSADPNAVAPASPATVCGTDETMNAYIWASNVRVHTGPSESNTAIGECGPSWVHAYCQLQGGEVAYGSYRNDWWIYADTKIGNFVNGYISDVFVQGGSNDAPVPGIPTC